MLRLFGSLRGYGRVYMNKTQTLHIPQQVKRSLIHYFYSYCHKINIKQKLETVYTKEIGIRDQGLVTRAFLLFSLFTFLLTSCPQPDGSSHSTNPVNPAKPDRTLVVFDNTHGLCTTLVYDDYRRRSEDKIAEVPAGRRSAEIEYYPGDSVPFYFAYVISLNDFSGFTMNYVPKNGMDQRTVNVAANAVTSVHIPKLDETFSKPDQLLSQRSFLLLQNASNYSFELHQGRSSVKPDSAVSSPVVNSTERAFYTIEPKAALNYMLLVGADYKDFPSSPDTFKAGYFYNFTYNGNIVFNNEIPVNLENIAIKTYTVTFNSNGANGTAPTAQVVNAGSAVTLPNRGGLSKEGYTFGGWNASASGTEINYGAGASYTVTGDINLYATWHPIGTIIYTVDFDSDGGTATASQDIVSGKQAFRPADPIRRGNIFIDWYSDSGFNSLYDFSKPVIGAITVYAKWEAIRYTVTFNANGASGITPASQTANALSSITLPNGNGLSNAGYSFGGWSVDDTGGEAYEVGASYTVESDITLFAVWNLQPYTVNFYSNGGSVVQSQSVTYGSRAVRPADPVRNGYKFLGWFSDTGLMETYDFSGLVTGNVALYAKWSSVVNGIRLNKNALNLIINRTETLNASMNTGNTLIDAITWSSSNTQVAAIAQNGTVTAISGGSAIITASAGGGLHTAQCTVTVTAVINSVEELQAYLSRIPANTGAAPYIIELNVSSFGGGSSTSGSVGSVLMANNTKYVNLDLSGSSITSIPEFAFYIYSTSTGCASLTEIILPDSVTSIGNGAFAGCTSLNGIIVGTANTAYSSENGILFNKDKNTLIAYPGAKKGAFAIPNTVTGIGNFAFEGCAGLTGVTIPNTVISIGRDAFYGCASLASITIPNSVTSMGTYVFSGCSSLADVTIGNGVTGIGDSTFAWCTSLINITIPDNITSIGNQAFHDCLNLATVTMPNNLNSIGFLTFSGCRSLTNITIPDSVTSISQWAFSGCAGLVSITIPNASIESEVFENCTSLNNVTIGSGVTSIKNKVFSGCTSFTSITFQGPFISNNLDYEAFNGLGDLRDKYRAGGIGTYTRASGGDVWTKQ